MPNIVPSLPDKLPRSNRPFVTWLGRKILSVMGWKIVGELPNVPKVVLCGAPHTSNWDFVLAMSISMGLGLRFNYLMKKEAFFWPFKGLFMSLGGIPINRGSSEDVVKQIAKWYREHDQVWLAITPEGTRSKVDKWKTGFLRIAEEANVPVFVVAWNYPEKVFYLDTIWETTGDHVEDAESIRDYINSKYQGRHPEKQ